MFSVVHQRPDHPLGGALQAVTEVVRAQLSPNVEPTSIHFFGALMSGLDSSDSSEHWPDLLKLLVLLLAAPSSVANKSTPTSLVPAPVLRSRYTQAMQVFASVLQRGSSLGPAVLRPLILCIGAVLSAQDSGNEFWNIPANKRALMTLTELLVDERPKVRRAANDAVHRVLLEQRLMGGAGASRIVADFCDQVVRTAAAEDDSGNSKSVTMRNETMALQIISFLRLSSSLFTAKATKKLLQRTTSLVLKRAAHTSARGCATLATKAIHHFICNKESPIHPNTMIDIMGPFLEPWSSKIDSSLVCAVANLIADGISRVSKMPSSDINDAARRDLAVNVLPRVSATLVGLFHSSSKDVHRAVSDAFARVIVNCVDERLVNETNQAMQSPSSGQRIALPLEHVVSSLDSLLQPRYTHAWSSILPLLSGLFRHLAATADPVAGPILCTISSLLDRGEESSNGKLGQSVAPGPVRDLLEDVAGAAVEAMGAAAFLRHVPIGNPAAASNQEIDASMACLDRRLWVLPVLKRHVRRTRSSLACFHRTITGMARLCEAVASTNEQIPSANSETSSGQSPGEMIAVMMRSRSMQLWELFVSFCYRPVDMPTYWNTLAPMLGKAVTDQRYPVLQQNICAGLTVLIRRHYIAANPAVAEQAASRNDEDDDDESQQDSETTMTPAAAVDISQEEAQAILPLIAKFAPNFLPILFSLYEKASMMGDGSTTTSDNILTAASWYCKLASPSFLDTIATKLLTNLLKATTADVAAEDYATSLLGLGLAVVGAPQLSNKSVHDFFRTLRPLLSGEVSDTLQKRAYKVLSSLCEHHISKANTSTAEWAWVGDLGALLQDSLLSVSSTVKRHRLKCLSFVVKGLDLTSQTGKDFVVRMIGEVIICTKESNAKAREAAFDVLVSTARAMSKCGQLADMFNMVIAGLAAKTSHMRSATVFALSRLLYDFANEGGLEGRLTELVSTVCLLLHENSREVVKAVIGFVKVVSVRFTNSQLEPLVSTIITGLMRWAKDSKNRFRQRIRIVLERLIKRVGYDVVAAHVPEDDTKLMNHIAKMKTRRDRKRDKNSSSGGGGSGGGGGGGGGGESGSAMDVMESKSAGGSTSGGNRKGREQTGATFDELMVESDDEDEDDKNGGGSGSGGGGGRRVVEERIVEGDGVPMDLLDSKSSMQLVAREGRRSKSKGKQDLDLDANGRMIVPMDEEEEDFSQRKGGRRDNEDDDEEDDEDGRAEDLRSINSKSSKHTSETTDRPSKRQKSKTADDGTTGARFRSNKAGGDVRRKGDKSLPFAYVQMGSGFLNRRQKHQNVRKFEAISSAAQRGAMKGSKNKRKR